jgi:NTE family protein
LVIANEDWMQGCISLIIITTEDDDLPIKSSFEKVRLLIVSVGILDCTTAATFDSYTCKIEYGEGKTSHILEYIDGINVNHVLTSMSPYVSCRYPELRVTTLKYTKNNAQDQAEVELVEMYRVFWDGAYPSNTSLREVLQVHRDYWYGDDMSCRSKEKMKDLAPELEVLVNLYLSIRNEIPVDADSIQDRELTIRSHDRTKHDVKVAKMTTNYLDPPIN